MWCFHTGAISGQNGSDFTIPIFFKRWFSSSQNPYMCESLKMSAHTPRDKQVKPLRFQVFKGVVFIILGCNEYVTSMSSCTTPLSIPHERKIPKLSFVFCLFLRKVWRSTHSSQHGLCLAVTLCWETCTVPKYYSCLDAQCDFIWARDEYSPL